MWIYLSDLLSASRPTWIKHGVNVRTDYYLKAQKWFLTSGESDLVWDKEWEKMNKKWKLNKVKEWKMPPAILIALQAAFPRNLEELQTALMNSSAKVSHYLLTLMSFWTLRLAFFCGAQQEKLWILILIFPL